jgi:RNA polymerase sigma factor (sigma-70 family)
MPATTTDDLWRAYLASGNTDVRLRNQLVEVYVSYVQSLVRWLARRHCEFALDHSILDDLQSAAYLALVNAVERFNPTRGNRFKTYLQTAVRHEARRELNRLVGRRPLVLERDMPAAIQDVVVSTRINPTNPHPSTPWSERQYNGDSLND